MGERCERAVIPGRMMLARCRVVLVRPQEPGNVGAAARAMANMGLGSMVVVRDPSRPDPTVDARAHAMAAGARAALESVRVVDGLDEAIAGCVLAVGFTSRRRVRRQPALIDLEEAAPFALDATARGHVALVFGTEDKGLSNEDLASCGMLVRISAAARAPVLNLAGAVLVVGYALRRGAARGAAREPGAKDGPQPCGAARVRTRGRRTPGAEPLATVAELERLYALWRDLLVRASFLRDREAQGMITLRGILGRARLEAREHRFLMGALRQLARRLDESPGVHVCKVLT